LSFALGHDRPPSLADDGHRDGSWRPPPILRKLGKDGPTGRQGTLGDGAGAADGGLVAVLVLGVDVEHDAGFAAVREKNPMWAPMSITSGLCRFWR